MRNFIDLNLGFFGRKKNSILSVAHSLVAFCPLQVKLELVKVGKDLSLKCKSKFGRFLPTLQSIIYFNKIIMNRLLILFDLFLALLSFIFAKVYKFIIGNLYTLSLIFNKKKVNQWRVIDNNLVRSPLNLAVLMTKAPRWNTHAIIGTLGPFSVQNSVSIELKSPHNSARSWIAIFYSFPSYKTITWVESNQVDYSQDYHSLSLPSGKYTIGLRYYNYYDNLVLPAVRVDGQELTSSQEIPSNSNQFYETLIERKNWLFLAIHYYVYTILRWQKFLPPSFVQNEFLPVGATDTKFFYDYLDQNEYLELKTDESTLNKYDIYVTLYDRCSLPVSSFQLTNIQQNSQVLTDKGYYLIRVRSDVQLVDKFADLNLVILRKFS